MNNVIYEILKLVIEDKWYGVSNHIEIAKGKNKLKTSFKERQNQFVRNLLFIMKKQH